MKLATTVTLLSFAALLGGCGAHSLVPGQSTEADVRTSLGAPNDTRAEANGDKLWEYATGPEGFTTRRVRIGADGRVKEVSQLLTEEQFAQIVPGQTTRTQVRSLLGRPADETVYRSGPTWSWRFLGATAHPGFMVVSFNPNDTVRDKIIILDQYGDSHDE